MDAIQTTFITGATGYVGRSVARAFRRAGYRVLGLTRDRERAAGLAAEEIEPVIGALQEPDAWRDAAAAADVLVHAAVDYTTDTMALDRATTARLIALARGRRATVIYTSGTWVHGDTAGRVADETSLLAPTAIVAARPQAEALVLDATDVSGIVLRPAIVFGGRGGLTAPFFEDRPVVGGGDNHWALVHVEDLAGAYVSAARRGRARSVYLIADRSRRTVRELVTAARRAAGLTGEPRWLPVEEARKTLDGLADALALDQQVSAARAERELGWRPAHAGFVEEAGLYAAANGKARPLERRTA